jgi:hypothetical protein
MNAGTGKSRESQGSLLLELALALSLFVGISLSVSREFKRLIKLDRLATEQEHAARLTYAGLKSKMLADALSRNRGQANLDISIDIPTANRRELYHCVLLFDSPVSLADGDGGIYRCQNDDSTILVAAT